MLHIDNDTPANMVNINQHDNTNNNRVEWYLEKNDDYYIIRSVANPNFVVDLNHSDNYDGVNVTLYEFNNTDAQKWYLEKENSKPAAPTNEIANEVFESWKQKFYYTDSNGGHFHGQTENWKFWGVAEMMELVVDAYETTGETKYKNMFDDMYRGFIHDKGSDWSWNDFNDDIAWAVLACVRAHLLTGNMDYLNTAKEQFDKMFARADTRQFGGYGLVWKQGVVGTNACINGPAMVACCYLAKATGDLTYYEKAIDIFEWSKLYLLDVNNGKVNDNYNGERIDYWSSTYNQGTYLGAAVMLYNYTKDPSYKDIAHKIALYTKNDMYNSRVMHNEEGGGDLPGFKGIFMRYARKYMSEFNNTNILPWLQLNAKVAYNNRNTEGIIWTKWSERTDETTEYTEWSCSAAVSLMINCPKETSLTKDAYSIIEAEDMDYFKGVIVESCPDGTDNLGGIQNGSFSAYHNVDFGPNGAQSATFRVSCGTNGGIIEIRADSKDGRVIGNAIVEDTGGWENYVNVSCEVENIKGVHHIYLIYKGDSYVTNINNFKFIKDNSEKIASFYKDCNFEGTEIKLDLGEYTLNDMLFNGLEDNDISSLKVKPGYQVVLYADDNFQGDYLIVENEHTCLVFDNFNDVCSSLRIEEIPNYTYVDFIHNDFTLWFDNQNNCIVVDSKLVDNSNYNIYNISGNIVSSGNVTTTCIDVNDISSGFYIANFTILNEEYNITFYK